MSNTQAPSLFGGAETQMRMPEQPRQIRTLADLMYDGFYMLFLLKNRHAPSAADVFTERVSRFLAEFERNAKRMDASTEDIYAAKYAFCAAVDETILTSNFNIRETWERQPLQLAFFGDQLAGEHFFQKLEQLRAQGASRVQALEIFYLCLLLGFRGKYFMEGQEKLNYLIARVGDDVAHHKGKRAKFAPFWKLPDRISHVLRNEIPIWVMASAFSLLGLLAYLGLQGYLSHNTEQTLAGYHDVVKLAPRAASLTITLP